MSYWNMSDRDLQGVGAALGVFGICLFLMAAVAGETGQIVGAWWAAFGGAVAVSAGAGFLVASS